MISDDFLTSGEFLNQKRKKKNSQEKQKNLDSKLIAAVFHFVDPVKKRRLKT